MNECIICEKVGGNLVDKPTESSFETLLERIRERHRYRDQADANFAERTVDVSPATLFENHATYHRVKRTAGRPSLNNSNALEECEYLTTRSRAVPYMKDICIICQKQGGKLHRVEFKTTGQNMLQVSKMLTDKLFSRRLNTITSAKSRSSIASVKSYQFL